MLRESIHNLAASQIALCVYGAEVLGTQIDSIVATEDREIFKAGKRSM